MIAKTFATDLLRMILSGQAIAGFADAPAAGKINQIWVGLHTSDPGAAGTQETAECNYTGYTRIAVDRNALAWNFTESQASASPVARIDFPEVRGGNQQEAVYVSFGTSKTGAGKLMLRGKLDPSITCKIGVTPGIKHTATIRFVTDEVA